MDKIRSLFQKIPVKAAFYICVSAFALLAAALSFFTCKTAREKLFDIESNYSVRLSDSSYSEGDSVIYYNLNLNGAELSPQDKRAFVFYNALNDFAPVFWSLACLICSAAVFYSLVLKQPLYILKQASANIADRNLDFSIPCSGKNEFSKLCNSFEAMRRSLCENNREMTEMIEQRKRLNDAYTHELRTPAAVLKGCADMILKYFPKGEMPEAELTETVGIMSEHISRIEAPLL